MIDRLVTCDECGATLSVPGSGERHHTLTEIRRFGWDNPDGGELELCPKCLDIHRAQEAIEYSLQRVEELRAAALTLATRPGLSRQWDSVRLLNAANRHQANPGQCHGCDAETEASRVLRAAVA